MKEAGDSLSWWWHPVHAWKDELPSPCPLPYEHSDLGVLFPSVPDFSCKAKERKKHGSCACLSREHPPSSSNHQLKKGSPGLGWASLPGNGRRSGKPRCISIHTCSPCAMRDSNPPSSPSTNFPLGLLQQALCWTPGIQVHL